VSSEKGSPLRIRENCFLSKRERLYGGKKEKKESRIRSFLEETKGKLREEEKRRCLPVASTKRPLPEGFCDKEGKRSEKFPGREVLVAGEEMDGGLTRGGKGASRTVAKWGKGGGLAWGGKSRNLFG